MGKLRILILGIVLKKLTPRQPIYTYIVTLQPFVRLGSALGPPDPGAAPEYLFIGSPGRSPNHQPAILQLNWF